MIRPRRRLAALIGCSLALLPPAVGRGQDRVTIRVDPAKQVGTVSPYLAAVCLEDVNHEVYGGLYSQLIFGESFQEPPVSEPARGFVAFGGQWSVSADGVLDGDRGNGGPKVVRAAVPPDTTAIGVDVFLPGGGGGNAGLIVGVRRPGVGDDAFDGEEVTLDAAAHIVRVGRHRHDFRLIRDTPCPTVDADRWIGLSVARHGRTVDVLVDGTTVFQFDGDLAGGVGLRQWGRSARYRNLWASSGGSTRTPVPFEPGETGSVSGMWRPFHRGDATGTAAVERADPFVGTQCQRVTFAGGTGEVGVENRGLNRQGIGLVAGRPYRGHLWAKADVPVRAAVALASADGARSLASAALSIDDARWHRYDFTLTPTAADPAARFEAKLTSAGSAAFGYVFLEPGDWGTFKGLPVRRDVAEALVDQGVTAVRYGGSMVNDDHYRWKQMIGDRDRRPPYEGLWYPYSTNGWGIIDFLNLCEAAGFLPVPAFCLDETPRDMADFVEYVNGPPDSPWGRHRVADGHPAPYRLTHLELGNEEKVDAHYYDRLEPLARAIWTVDPRLVLTVGDFAYHQPIADPMRVRGASVSDLSAHRRILSLAKQFDAEVWFDVHVWTRQPPASNDLRALPTYVNAIDALSAGAKHHVVVFELNADNHQQRRAVANAQAMIRIANDGRLPFVASANCLQVDGQNDNGWDQGLLFLNPTTTWLQPPGYATRMAAAAHQPRRVGCVVDGTVAIDVLATASDDGRTVVVQVVNPTAAPVMAAVTVAGRSTVPMVEVLAADPAAANTADRPNAVRPTTHPRPPSGAPLAFEPNSYTVLTWKSPDESRAR